MTKDEAWDIAYEVKGLIELLSTGQAPVDGFGTSVKGIIDVSPKILNDLVEMNLSDDEVELLIIIGVSVNNE